MEDLTKNDQTQAPPTPATPDATKAETSTSGIPPSGQFWPQQLDPQSVILAAKFINGLIATAIAAISTGAVGGLTGLGINATNTTDTKLTGSSQLYAAGVTVDAANNKMTIVTAGKYIVTAALSYAAATAAKTYQCEVFKNGSAAIQRSSNPGGTIANPNAVEILDLAVGDVLELYTWQNSGGTLTASSGFLTIALVKTT